MPSAVMGEWFWVPRVVTDPAVRLVCVPFAGGDAPAYRSLAMSVPSDVEV